MTHYTSLSDADLVAATKELVRRSTGIEAELIEHLGEIDARELYRERSCSSMFIFCVEELGFSEDAAYYRITVARAGRKWPTVIASLRCGTVHLAGLRLLSPHLTDENHRDLLAAAAGKSKRRIEELVARFAPPPPLATVIRRVPEPKALQFMAAQAEASSSGTAPLPPALRARVQPVAEEVFRVAFTTTTAVRDKLQHAKDLLRHRVPTGDLPSIFDLALDALIERVEKERFGKGRKPRAAAPVHDATAAATDARVSRNAPAPMRREVYARDEERCSFVDERGKRCSAKAWLEVDHVDGFARTREHRVDGLRLLCRTHNQLMAEKMYGRELMSAARGARKAPTRPGASSPAQGASGTGATPGESAVAQAALLGASVPLPGAPESKRDGPA